MDNGDNVDVVYLGFAKAFDTVPHRRLLMKLQNYGVGGTYGIGLKISLRTENSVW